MLYLLFSNILGENSNSSKYEEDEEEHVIEKILNERIEANKKEYLVKWKDYEDEDNTWEPKENLSPEIIEEYEIENGIKEKGEYVISSDKT